jgi:hypothetical protein
MNKRFTLIAAYFSFVGSILFGCASSDNHLGNVTDSNISIPYHGNFCGPGIPSLPPSTIEERVKALKAIKPVDILDRICKLHDICYAVNGYRNKKCDDDLVENIINRMPQYIPNNCVGSENVSGSYVAYVLGNIASGDYQRLIDPTFLLPYIVTSPFRPFVDKGNIFRNTTFCKEALSPLREDIHFLGESR